MRRESERRFGFGHMGSAAGLFPGPACACDKKQFGVRTNGLGIGGKRRASCASGGLNQHLQVVSIGKTSAAASEGRNLNVSRWRERAVAIELFSGKWRRIVMMANRTSVSRVTLKWQASWLKGGAFAGGTERHRVARKSGKIYLEKGDFCQIAKASGKALITRSVDKALIKRQLRDLLSGGIMFASQGSVQSVRDVWKRNWTYS